MNQTNINRIFKNNIINRFIKNNSEGLNINKPIKNQSENVYINRNINRNNNTNTNNKIIINPLNSTYFKNKSNVNMFVDIVYKNFINLVHDPNLKHSKMEINKLLFSPNFKGYFVKENDKIIGYLLGEITKLNDRRKVYFISYIYTSKYYRKHGIASKLMELVMDMTKSMKLDTVMLICDTEDDNVYNFYLKKGFMLDFTLRRYNRHDVLSLPQGVI